MTTSRIHGVGLARLRRLRGMSVEECAALAQVEEARWRAWEAGDRWPTEWAVWAVFHVSRETVMRLGAATPENG